MEGSKVTTNTEEEEVIVESEYDEDGDFEDLGATEVTSGENAVDESLNSDDDPEEASE
jgi:hypothetical protein